MRMEKTSSLPPRFGFGFQVPNTTVSSPKFKMIDDKDMDDHQRNKSPVPKLNLEAVL